MGRVGPVGGLVRIGPGVKTYCGPAPPNSLFSRTPAKIMEIRPFEGKQRELSSTYIQLDDFQ